MPVLGTGIIPTGQAATELTYVTRRAFAPTLVVQIWQSSPLASSLIANAHMASGGVSSLTVPVQGTPYVVAQTSNYSGAFNQPAALQGTYNAEFNLKLLITPIPFLGMEGAVQMDHAIIPLIEARMNDASNATVDLIANMLYGTDSTDPQNQQITGLPFAVDDGTDASTYGNIARSNSWWQSKLYNATSSAYPTRNNVLQYIIGCNKYGSEMPVYGVMGPGTWGSLAQDITSLEQYQISQDGQYGLAKDGARAMFTAITVAGVPIYMDQYCPEGILYLLNPRYMSFYIHEAANFAFTGFVSTLPNYALGYVGALVAIMEMAVVKPKAMVKVYNYEYLTV